MARALRIVYEGALYHITNRGNEKANIFKDENDKRVYLRLLKETIILHQWICYGYCLMNNHYHLLIETPKANISAGMKKINAEYTQYFNYKHKRIGHLFQGRYKATLVKKESHLLELCRYIVLNPVRAGLCQKPEDYVWSSYKATVVKSQRKDIVERAWILSQFSEKSKNASSQYKNFVNESSADVTAKRVNQLTSL
jgi:REP element-mobilizing transposase RayT